MLPMPFIAAHTGRVAARALSTGSVSWAAGSFAANTSAVAGLVAAAAAVLVFASGVISNWAKRRHEDIETAVMQLNLRLETKRADEAEAKASKYEERYTELLERLGLPPRKDDD